MRDPLRSIQLDSPCPAERPRFEERDGGRFCFGCQKIQYDLFDATRSEVLALIDANGGRICGRLHTGPGGEPRFKPEPPARGATVLRGAAIAVALAACGSPPEALLAPEPTTATPPPTLAEPPTPPPPASTVPVDPELPPTSGDAFDHSTDGSPNLADHQQHRHRHPVVQSVGVSQSGHTIYGGGMSGAPPGDLTGGPGTRGL